MSIGFASTARSGLPISVRIVRSLCWMRLGIREASRNLWWLIFSSFVEHCLRHSKDHAHHCPVCRQSLRSDSQIHAHCAYHMSHQDSTSSTSSSPITNGFSFVCPICGEKLDDGFALIEHTKIHLWSSRFWYFLWYFCDNNFKLKNKDNLRKWQFYIEYG